MGIADRQYTHPWGCTCPRCNDDYRKREEELDAERALSKINGDLIRDNINKDRRWCSGCGKYVKGEVKTDEVNHCVICVCILCGKILYKRKFGEENQMKKPNLPIKENEEQTEKQTMNKADGDLEKGKIKKDAKKDKSFEDIWRYSPHQQSVKHTEKSTLWSYITRGFRKAKE